MFHLSGGVAAGEHTGTDSLGTWLMLARAGAFWPS
jgi:hypothetical protein